MPVKIYRNVYIWTYLGYTPILGAMVMATVERPGGNETTVELKDSGTGLKFI